eukprot:302602-Alexandrium_andersonii.AAC.1
MMDYWGVAEVPPLTGRRVDCSKGDRGQYDVRLRWVAAKLAYHHSDQFCAATAPLRLSPRTAQGGHWRGPEE